MSIEAVPSTSIPVAQPTGRRLAGPQVAALALGGAATAYALATVKWLPLPAKVGKALASHTLGGSILTGGRSLPPAPSWAAAWGYAQAYFGAVATAVVAGLVIGGAVQALVPAAVFRRLAGSSDLRATLGATLGALPVML